MNDDFLKRHQERLDPHFVETFYQQLDETNNRRLFTMTNKTYGWKSILAALLIIFVCTFAFIPQARAALSAVFSFNGVDVGVDSETDDFVVTGNTDAVVYQDENNVIIEDGDGVLAGISKDAIAVDSTDVADLQAQFPDFVMPTNVPEGYTLVNEAGVFDSTIAVSWEHPSNETISYMWGMPAFPDMDMMGEFSDGAIMIDGNSDVDIDELPEEVQQLIAEHNQPFQIVPGMDGSNDVMLQTEVNGVTVQILATDETLNEADLRAMLP